MYNAVNTRRKRYSGGEGLNAGSSTRNRHDDQHVGGTGGGTTHRIVPHEQAEQHREIGEGASHNSRRRSANPCTSTKDRENTPSAAPLQTALSPISDKGNNANPLPENVAASSSLPVKGTKIGTKGRFKWSLDMNSHLYRTYLHITRMETEHVQYGKTLHQEMIREFPELATKTLQNILDQRRQLFTKNRLAPEVIKRIRDEVSLELGLTKVNTHHSHVSLNNETVLSEEQEKAYSMLQKYIMMYSGIDPKTRPPLTRLKITTKSNKTVTTVDSILKLQVSKCKDLRDLHDVIYAAALTTLELNDQLKIGKKRTNTSRPYKPQWDLRLSKKIETLRTEIGIMVEYSRTSSSVKVKRKAIEIMKKYETANNANLSEIVDYQKQKLKVLANRLRRYRISYKRRIDNRDFTSNQRNFYRRLNNTDIVNTGTTNQFPEPNEIHNLWSGIWGAPTNHKHNSDWLKSETQRMEKINQMIPTCITMEDIKDTLHGTPNWKSPGQDKIQNFWYKKFTSTHHMLAKFFSNILNNPADTPEFMMKGITYLLPKTNPSSPDPSKYRPITCLPTIYKFFTGILANKIYKHVVENSIIADEQKGCRKRSRGYKEQLIIDTILTRDAINTRRNLALAYIDYQKAFDSVPHSWLLEVLHLYKICPFITDFLRNAMRKWETELITSGKEAEQSPIKIKIQRGLFQGDALSALWFCLALNPLSNAIQKKKAGYTLSNSNQEVSHALYVDDIKVYSNSSVGLKKILRVIENFSNDIRMNFGLDKCRISNLINGKWQAIEDYQLLQASGGGTILAMDRDEHYKYLGAAQALGIDDARVKTELKETVSRKLKAILRTKLSGLNTVQAVNTYVLPTITSSFGIIKWTETELEEANRHIRVAFTKHRAHHPRSSKERFHLPRSKGGRGIQDLRQVQQHQIQNLRQYFYMKAQDHPLIRIAIQLDTNMTPLKLAKRDNIINTEFSVETQMANWRRKELHGRYINIIDQSHINKQASLGWLTHGNLFPETEGFICAIQDQVIPTRSYRRYIMKDNSVDNVNCRLCGEVNETIEHLMNGCRKLAARDYTNRHNNVARIVHRELCLQYGLVSKSVAYYIYTPERVLENDKCLVYWDREILTDRTVQHNRPDIFLHDKTTNRIYLIEVSVPAPVNIERKNTEKIEKYVPLAEDVKDVRRVENVIIIPIIIGSTGEIPTKLIDNMKTLNMKKNVYLEMQKAAILGTCNIIRKTLNMDNSSQR